MNSKSRFVVAAILCVLGILLSPGFPHSSGGFRSEDFLAFDRDARVGLLDVLLAPHLGSTMVTFWRPLSEAAAWLVVRTVGPNATLVHLLLVALQVAAAASVGVALRRLFGLSAGAALATTLLALAHPFGPAVTTYFDGGLATLLAAIAVFQALAALGRWRDGETGAAPLFVWTLLAMLAYDMAIVLPVVLVVAALLLPRSERRAPWSLLALVPLLLAARSALLGRAFDGYGSLGEFTLRPLHVPEWLALFPQRLATCTARLFLPLFPGELHGRGETNYAVLLLGAVAVAAITVAVLQRRERVARPLRQGAAALAIVVGLVGLAPDLFLGGRDTRPDELVLAYKTWPAALASSLALGWLLGRAAGRRWWGSLALAAPWIAASLWLRAPIAAAHDEALEWGAKFPASIATRARSGTAERLLVLDVPVKTDRDGRSVTRALQYGLSSSLRPPFVARESFVYPLFRAEDGLFDWMTPQTRAALVASPWLTPLRCRFDALDVVPVERPAADVGATAVRLFASVEGPEPLLAPDLSNAPLVDVRRVEWQDAAKRTTASDVIELGVRGRAPGVERLVVLDRMHFASVWDAPPAMFLVRQPGPAGSGVERLKVVSAWFREIATRFPDDVVFVVLETRPDPTKAGGDSLPVTVSNVLPVRLHVAPR